MEELIIIILLKPEVRTVHILIAGLNNRYSSNSYWYLHAMQTEASRNMRISGLPSRMKPLDRDFRGENMWGLI